MYQKTNNLFVISFIDWQLLMNLAFSVWFLLTQNTLNTFNK